MQNSFTLYIALLYHLVCPFSSFRLRKNSNLKKSEDVGETNKGQKLIEKEAMETGQV